ncbi:platelet-activating factor acetylhydrolase IB subunit beta homolog isoform X2 [Drosophila busckii]|uniref:platelet-activating factor acetylhydrolase IB subunit beta homolog isoform X2 n=1 Tax=Drosophila busckii TaxID=30019 RepID=UPI001432974F|nr:platelet-activating factor acetylhydrolase IB subunit beta homolog isoform X2 [Drosophila busckii]
MNPCAVPTAVPDVDGDKRWQSIHRRFISDCREKDPDVIFLGDCIFETLQDTDTWNQYFAPLHCLNFSIRDDRTEHVLWRIENGALDNVTPKVVVLHVGTNNVSNSAVEVAEGVLANVTKIRQNLPGAYILLPFTVYNLHAYILQNSCNNSYMICPIKCFIENIRKKAVKNI